MSARAADMTACTEAIRSVRDALAADQNLSEESRHTVEQLLHDAAAAQRAGDAVVCTEMMEDAKELLGIDESD